MNKIIERMEACGGRVSLYYRPLCGGDAVCHNADMPLIAASIIKIPVMIEAFRRFESGEMDRNAVHVLREDEKKPSCGALNRMHAGLEVTMRDLVDLMIVLSDNTATNILIDYLGVDAVNATLRSFGATTTTLCRKLFDMSGIKAGLRNTICAGEIGMLLEKMYRGELISPEADAEMVDILKNQKLNGKFPFFLKPRGIKMAHKTGEDDNTTHDAAIIFTEKPFVLCMFSNDTDVPQFERVMQDAALELALMNQ